MCLSKKECEGLPELMIEFGLVPPSENEEGEMSSGEAKRMPQMASDADQVVCASPGDIQQFCECGRVITSGKPQFADLVNGHFLTIPIRSLDEVRHDRIHDD